MFELIADTTTLDNLALYFALDSYSKRVTRSLSIVILDNFYLIFGFGHLVATWSILHCLY